MNDQQIDNQNQNQKQNKKRFLGPALFLSGLAVGIIIMLLRDPQQGRHRRAFIRDRLVPKSLRMRKRVARGAEDLRNRVLGSLEDFASGMRHRNVDDRTLNSRIRSHFGRSISHPRSIHTRVSNGVVTLTGVILAAELDHLIDCVWEVSGVKDVVNNLDVRKTAEGVPGLPGSGPAYLQ